MLKDQLLEVGIIIRAFVISSYTFKNINNEDKNSYEKNQQLRASFLSAINTFVEVVFKNNYLEYLEFGNHIFVFKISKIVNSDNKEEPIIIYGLLEKDKRKVDKIVKKFLQKVEPILLLFISRYSKKDYCNLNEFEPFEKEIRAFFEIKK